MQFLSKNLNGNQYKCSQCDNYPALKLLADCQGDEEGPYCNQCWIDLIEVEFRQFYTGIIMVEDSK